MLVIRLTRVGKKNSPIYRVVVADKKKAVKRKFVEIVGNYNPTLNPKQIVFDKERILFWIKNGAQPSDTVRNLLCDQGILPKNQKVNKVYGRKLSKKQAKEEAGKKPQVQGEEPVAEEATDESTAPEEKPAENTAENKPENQEPIEEAKSAEEAEAETIEPEENK